MNARGLNSGDRVVKAHAVPIEHEIERRGIKNKLRKQGRELVGPCPVCGGDDRFSVNIAKGVWNCRGCGVGGNVIGLVEHLDHSDFKSAVTTLAGEAPPRRERDDKDHETTGAKQVVANTFQYPDKDGTVAFVVERIEYRKPDGSYVLKDGKRRKTFKQKRPDPDQSGAWLWNVESVPPIPYRLPELMEAIALGCAVLVVEGERKVDLLRSWNVPATCCAQGAKKWQAGHSTYLRDADVVILPDNDDAGREHMNVVAARYRALLLQSACSNCPICRRRATSWTGPPKTARSNSYTT
jgi:hypothetical protein